MEIQAWEGYAEAEKYDSTWDKSFQIPYEEEFIRVIYKDADGIHFNDFKDKEDLIRHSNEELNVISIVKFFGKKSKDVTHLYKKYFI